MQVPKDDRITRRAWLKLAGSALAGAALLPAAPALADPLDAAAIVDALLPARSGPVTRSMSRAATRGISIEGELPPELDLPKVSLTINFEFDSWRLTNDGMFTLRTLAKALEDKRLAGMQFQIAGHTDDVGTPAYNQNLSEQRARTVATHLANFYGIAADRLKPVGYGKSRPADPNNPRSPANRRVEIINLAPLSS